MIRTKLGIGAHPSAHQLMAFAESREDNQATVDARLASHVASCERCAAVVDGIRSTLAVAARVDELDPSAEATARLLLACRQERQSPAPVLAAMLAGRKPRRLGALAALAKGAAVAASLVVIASLSFNAALGEPQPERLQAMVITAPASEDEPVLDPAKMLREIQMFAAAISVGQGSPSVWEREQRRLVVDLDAELQAAKEALQHNPGSVRANNVYYANLERTAQTLRALYIRGD